jgi:hypothetical protein
MTRRALATTFGAGWLALLGMRIAMNYAGASGRPLPQLLMVIVPVTAFWLPVIGIALWVDRRTATRPAGIFIAQALIALLVAILEPWFVQQVLAGVGLARSYITLFVGRFDTNILIYAVIVVGDLALTRLEAFRVRERSAARLEQALADAQLHALAIQLQPHFLFNALQFVAESAHDDLPAARRTLSHLRGLMAQAFALERRVEVSLREELSFLTAYGEIQQSRFGDRFRLIVDAPDDVMSAAVPPLLLQPLVENAARHGFGSRGSGGTIAVTARANEGVLSIVVADDGVGPPVSVRDGQGLSVTRRRLERLHGEAATFKLVRMGDRTEARLRMPLREVQPIPTGDHSAPANASPVPLEPPGARMPVGMGMVLFWSGLMALVISATAVASLIGPAAAPFRIERLIADEIVGFPFWLAMTVAAVAVGRRLPIVRAIAVHAAIGITLTMAHVLLGDAVRRAVLGETYPLEAYQQWAVWDMLAYTALVLIARSHDLRDWVSEKAREEVALSAEVRAVNARLDRLHLMQADLMAELDRVIASPTMESLDRSVVEFAEFLRAQILPEPSAEGVPA